MDINAFVNSIYISGGIVKVIIVEFIRGVAWTCGAFAFAGLVYLTILKRMFKS